MELNTTKLLIIVKKELYSVSNTNSKSQPFLNLVFGAWDLIPIDIGIKACERTLNKFIWHRYTN